MKPDGALWPVFFLCAAALVAVGRTAAADQSKPDSPRAMFRALGVDDSFFDQFADGPPMAPGENESTLRVIFRLRVFPPVDLQRWALAEKELSAVAAQPQKHRGDVYRLRGRVLKIEPLKPDASGAQRYELNRYYRCRLLLEPAGQIAEIYTENVPSQWRAGAAPNADAGAFGVFLKLVGKDQRNAALVFAAPRLAWYPDDLLGRLGMDCGLLDSIVDRRPIEAGDREAFFQMLAAVGRAAPGQLLAAAEDNLPRVPDDWRWTDRDGGQHYSVEPLFNQPATQRGRLVELSGTARRIEEIWLDRSDPDIVARFGFDRYYMVSLFTDDSQGNPLTFCVRQLPADMPFGNLPRYGEAVRIAGFFLKTWSYTVQKTADPSLQPGDPKTHLQYSPLLIGRSLQWSPAPKPADNTVSNLIIGGLFLLAMVVIWFVAWRNRRRERKWLEKMETPPSFNLDH